MTAPNAAASDSTILSTWRRDYRLSLALLVAGIVILVAISAFSYWANSTGNYPTSFWPGLVIYLTGTAGGMLILLAGTVAYYHWRGLRLSEGSA
jgi:TRAP-type C4-dicarboxylate transport system permease small subunit